MNNRISLSGRCILWVLSVIGVSPAHATLRASEPARSPANGPGRRLNYCCWLRVGAGPDIATRLDALCEQSSEERSVLTSP